MTIYKPRIDYYQIKINEINREISENNRRIELEKFNIDGDLRFIGVAFLLLCYLIFLAYIAFDLRAFIGCCFFSMVAGIMIMGIYMAIYKIKETKKLLKLMGENNRLCLKLKFLYLKNQAACKG